MTMTQLMKRFFPNKYDYKPSWMRMMLGKVTDNPKRPVEHIMGGFTLFNDDYSLESPQILEKGVYVAYLECDWNTDLINSFTFSVLGYNTKIREAKSDEFPSFLKKCIKDYARTKVEKYRAKEEEPDIKAKHSLGDETAGYGFHYFQNDSKNDTTLVETIQYTKDEGIEFQFK